MQWPGRESKDKDDVLLPLATIPQGIGGFGDAHDPRDPRDSLGLRPDALKHARATSAQARGLADEFSNLTPAEAAARLGTSLTHGLSPAEALARFRDHGPNEIPHDPPEPLWRRFLGQFREPLILLLLASAGASIVVGNMDDAVSITVAVTIVVTVGFVQEYRSEKSIEALNHLVPNHAHLVRGGPGPVLASGRVSPMGGGGGAVAAAAVWTAGPEDQLDTTRPAGAVTPSDEVLDAASSKVMAAQLVPGDLVLFTTGDRIPADMRVTKAVDLTIDTSNLTGENEPVRTVADARRNNIAYMGTLVRSGYGQGVVFSTGGNTHFGTIATSVSGTESPRSPLQLSMDELGSQLSKFSFYVIGLISLVGWLQGKKLLDLFTISISLAVAAIPEGLPIIVTVTLALGVHRMARHNAIVRRMPKVETLGSVNVVCTDKTGTLTTNHMAAARIWHPASASDDGLDLDSAGAGDNGYDDAADDVTSTADPAVLRIVRIGNIANNARLAHQHSRDGAAARAVLSSTLRGSGGGGGASTTYTRWVGQPTDVAMLDLLDRFKEHDARESVGPRLSETPFSSERKWMGVTIGGGGGGGAIMGGGEFAYIKGAIDRVLEACDSYVGRDGAEVVLDAARRRQALEAADRMASQGLRVLAFASGPVSRAVAAAAASRARAVGARSGTPVGGGGDGDGVPPSLAPPPLPALPDEVYRGLTFAGIVGMRDPARPGVGHAIRRLMRGGVRVIMMTGDAEATAVAIARQLGMTMATAREHSSSQSAVRPVIRGDELDTMSDAALAAAIQNTTIFARTNPEHKLKIVRALQARGDIVAMTGDGVNDAPALKRADIGVSMGVNGTDVAKEAADMILTDDDFSTILRAIEEGKAIFSNIQNFLTFQLSTSAAGLSLVFLCTCLGYKNPLNAMQILWINIIMDGPPAQSLGVEAVDPDVMNRPPRKRSDPVLTRQLLGRVAQSAAIIVLGTMLVYRKEMVLDGVVTRRDTTMTFTAFVLFDMFNALACRSESKSVLRGEVGLLSNVLFNWAVALSLAGQMLVVYLPWLQDVFQTEALGFWDLALLVMLCSTVFLADEARKWWRYGRGRRRAMVKYSQAV